MIGYLFTIIISLMLAATAFAAPPDAGDIMKKSQAAFFYQGADFKARVEMTLVGKTGAERRRELTMLRKNYGPSGGDQKYFIYFFKPLDVKDMAFMVYKYPKKDDDRWLFVPGLNMVRRIAAQDAHSSFVGSDFTYEDVSGRDLDDDTHTVVREEKIGSLDCYVVKSVPFKESGSAHKLSWIDKGSFLPFKEEYYDKKGALVKVFTAVEVKEVSGRLTVTRRRMENVQTGTKTEVVYVKAEYNVGIEDSLFTERYLKQPPKRLVE
ncbi:MAG: outer membrane lipoprotein-sorting protein [Deltaproteobacteria bacterium]|nr:outer membrane lipoprotein-sorting protein [Deltaproteobacteria bacterium]